MAQVSEPGLLEEMAHRRKRAWARRRTEGEWTSGIKRKQGEASIGCAEKLNVKIVS